MAKATLPENGFGIKPISVQGLVCSSVDQFCIDIRANCFPRAFALTQLSHILSPFLPFLSLWMA